MFLSLLKLLVHSIKRRCRWEANMRIDLEDKCVGVLTGFSWFRVGTGNEILREECTLSIVPICAVFPQLSLISSCHEKSPL
jgi:hypothetical protein